MGAIITEKILLENPELVKAFTGLPAETFWELVHAVEVRLPAYERERHERPDRQRAVGGGRGFDQPTVTRVAQILTYLRLHILQHGTALLYGGTQPDVSRDLRRLLPLIQRFLPCPEVWTVKEESQPLTATEVLTLADLADQRVLVDATEQVVYRSQDNQ